MSAAPRRVLLVGWEGADWNVARPLLEAGRLPHLAGIVERGVMGTLESGGPPCTPLLWTTLATGRHADEHGVLGDLEPAPGAAGVRSTGSHTRRCPALWNLLAAYGRRALVIGWPGSHPAETIPDGVVVSELFARAGAADPERWPLAAGAVAPAERAGALAELRLHPADLRREHLLPFVPAAGEGDPGRDPALAALAWMLAEASSVHAVATALLAEQRWDLAAVCYDLVDRASHAFMALRPPRREGVPRALCERYRRVVDEAYVHCDRMLGRLLEGAGPDTAVLVLSEHGFHSDQRRPATASGGRRDDTAWHRSHGLLAFAGPGVRRDEWVWGADLLSIAPTVLALLGLPLPEDLPGRVLWEAFETPPQPALAPATAPVEPPPAPAEVPGGAEQLARLVEHGFCAPERLTAADAGAREADTLALHAALVRLESRRPEAALPLLEALHARAPEHRRTLLHLARCREALGDVEESRRLLERFHALGRPSPLSRLLLARLERAAGRPEEALVQLFEAEQGRPDSPLLHGQIGEVYLQMGRPADAEDAFRRALALDADDADAHHGLARAALATRRNEAAAEAALAAIARRHRFPLAHYHLGVALVRLGRLREALRAFEVAVAQQPTLREAHRVLAELHEHVTGDVPSATLHRAQAQRRA